jgi:hypothetical protein
VPTKSAGFPVEIDRLSAKREALIPELTEVDRSELRCQEQDRSRGGADQQGVALEIQVDPRAGALDQLAADEQIRDRVLDCVL